MIESPPHIRSLKAYVPGKPIEELKRELNLKKIVKLASNENPCGPSPKAIKAIEKHLSSVHMYPDVQCYELIDALAAAYLRKPEEFVCGSGVDALLAYIIATLTTPEDEVLAFEGSFVGIYVSTHKLNRKLKALPLNKSYQFDLPLLLESITHKTKIIYLANPNNPTGAFFSQKEFEYLMSKISQNIIVILDEAYTSFASQHQEMPNGIDYELHNLIVTRTFSKDYGLAGLRVGFAVGPEQIIANIRKVKHPFEPNSLAQCAAIAALDDYSYIHNSLLTAQTSLNRMMALFKKIGMPFVPPGANFIMMILPDAPSAETFTAECLKRGLILRHCAPFGIPDGVRISAGTKDETTFALEIIRDVYKNRL